MAKSRVKCPYCKGTHIWKIGTWPTTHSGVLQRYKCINPKCARTFTKKIKSK